MSNAPFKKTVRLGTINTGGSSHQISANVFARIEFDGRKLGITGVEGPLRNGNALGGCGQIVMGYTGRDKRYPVKKSLDTFAPGWDAASVSKFFDIWDRWHLNDMNAACEHQRAAGWSELALEERTLYRFRLTDATESARRKAHERAQTCLKKGKLFQPTTRETFLVNLKDEIVSHNKALGKTASKFYEPATKRYDWQKGPEEVKTRNWLSFDEHPDGLLGKPCPVCGYKYGSEWKHEDVPSDVLDFLRGLPDSEIVPAWV